MQLKGFHGVKHTIKANTKIIDEIRSKLIHNFNLNFISKKLRIINLYNTGQKLNHIPETKNKTKTKQKNVNFEH